MNILFLHRNFPAQFRHLVSHLSRDKRHKVAFLSNTSNSKIDGIINGIYELTRKSDKCSHNYLKEYEESIVHGQCAARLAMKLNKSGFNPDLIVGHSWGPISFMKDVFPNVPLIGYFEWFYNSRNSDVDFGVDKEIPIDTQAKVRIKNSHLLIDLFSCDGGIVPTNWQKSQFPDEFKPKLHVIHDGIDTDFFKPAESGNGLSLPSIGLHLPKGTEIVTYATRGMEPYRGFPQFMEAVARVQKQRPNCHVVVSGKETVSYGYRLADGKTYKKLMLEKYDFDMSRLHFTGFLSYPDYLKVLQASSVHVYLTYPFVLSWSMLESMAAGCVLIASDTPPVKEVIRDGLNGFLVDFFSPEKIAEKVSFVLDQKRQTDEIRQNARSIIMENYNLKDCLDRQMDFLSCFM